MHLCIIGRRVARFRLRKTWKYPCAGVNCVDTMPNTQASRALLPRLNCKKVSMYIKRKLGSIFSTSDLLQGHVYERPPCLGFMLLTCWGLTWAFGANVLTAGRGLPAHHHLTFKQEIQLAQDMYSIAWLDRSRDWSVLYCLKGPFATLRTLPYFVIAWLYCVKGKYEYVQRFNNARIVHVVQGTSSANQSQFLITEILRWGNMGWVGGKRRKNY